MTSSKQAVRTYGASSRDSHSTQFSGNASTPSPSPCNWAGIPPFWVISNTARQTRDNRTITVDLQNEATYYQLRGDGKAFVECVLAFLFALGFQLTHKATGRGGGCLTRHSHDVRVRLGGVPI
jgi:hypothetical protein